MMKYFFFTVIFWVCSLQLYPQQKNKSEKLNTIELESFSRRLRTRLVVSADSAVYYTNTSAKKVSVTPKQWQSFYNIVARLKLDKVPGYPAPTHKRAVDAAMHCRLKLKAGSKWFESQYFDCGTAPKALQQLYNAMDALRQQIAEEEAP